MRIISAPLKIAFNKLDSANLAIFRGEFDRLSENNDDPISVWLRNVRSRGKSVDENEPIIQLLVELHRKIDALNAQISNVKEEFLALDSNAILESISHNLLIFNDSVLESGEKYYARLDIAVFPVRKIPLFFYAKDSKNAEIYLMHGRDEVDFDNYIAARERSLIREAKAKY